MKHSLKTWYGAALALVMFASMAFVDAPGRSDSTQLGLTSIKAVTIPNTVTGLRDYQNIVQSNKKYQKGDVIILAVEMQVKNIGKGSGQLLSSIADREIELFVGSDTIDLSYAKNLQPVVVANIYEGFSTSTSIPGLNATSTFTVLDISSVSSYSASNNTFSFGLIGQEKNALSFFDTAGIVPMIVNGRVRIAALKAKDGTETITVGGQTSSVTVKAPDSLEYTAIVAGTVKANGVGNMYAKIQTAGAEKFQSNGNGQDVMTIKDKYTIYREYVPASRTKTANDVVYVSVNGLRMAQVNPQGTDGSIGPLVTQSPDVVVTPPPYQTTAPTTSPTTVPTTAPTTGPTTYPTTYPTTFPTSYPTTYPTVDPSGNPTEEPMEVPTEEATTAPTTEPTTGPTTYPTTYPTVVPSSYPTAATWAPSATPTPGVNTVPNINWAGGVSKTNGKLTTAYVTYGSDGKTVIGENGIVVYTIADASGNPIVALVSEYTYYDNDAGKSIGLFAPASDNKTEARRLYNVGSRFYYADNNKEYANSSDIVKALNFFGFKTGFAATYKVMGRDFEAMGAGATFQQQVNGSYNGKQAPLPTEAPSGGHATENPSPTATATAKPQPTPKDKNNNTGSNNDDLDVVETEDGKLLVPKTGDGFANATTAFTSLAGAALAGIAAILKRLRVR